MKNKILKTCLLSVAIFVCLTVALLAACTPKTVTKTEEKFVGTYQNKWYTLEIEQDNTIKCTNTRQNFPDLISEYVWNYLEETDQIIGTKHNEDGTSSTIYLKDFTYNSSGKCDSLTLITAQTNQGTLQRK